MRCGFYESDITPPLGTTMFGYSRKRKSTGIKERLYAKAAVLESEGKYVALLSLEALEIPDDISATVRRRVFEYTGIEENSILIAAIHTHTGIPTQLNLGVYNGITLSDDEPELDADLDAKVIEMTALLAADAVILAYQRLQEVNIHFAIGKVEGISFVREHITKTGEIRTNPPWDEAVRAVSDPDTELPVFLVTNKEEEPLGIITSFALHHDTVQGTELSPDYSGLMAKKLKERFGTNFVTVFFAGFCGNINHFNYYQKGPRMRTSQEIADILTQHMLETIQKAKPIVGSEIIVKKDTVKIKKRELPTGYIEEIKEIMKNPPKGTVSIADPDTIKYSRSTTLIRVYEEDKTKEFDVPVQVIKIGDCLIYGLVGEIFAQFAVKLRSNSPTGKNMLVELAHESGYIYIPSADMFLPTVYESAPTSARLEVAAGDKMIDKAMEIAKELY